MQFDEFDFSDDVLDALDAMQFSSCTPIQEQAIPVALSGRDLIAVAQTGTGKTAAYLLPVLNRLAEGKFPEDAINCLVMAPTRELAIQIDRQVEGFSYFLGVSSLPIYGGTDGATFSQQQKGLKMGADVVIGTPGRLLAHIEMGYVDLSRVSFFILDEADRMLDMGFYDDIMQIARRLPAERQTMLFSATMPPKIQQLAKSILHDPAEIKIAVSRPADKIRQRVAYVGEEAKDALLEKILQGDDATRVIVFASSKLKVRQLARRMRGGRRKTGEMHSDLDQAQREQVMHDFKAGRVEVLIATDIVARGIDIDDITMVINYDIPHDAEDYVHRIGRTARAEADGTALTLVSPRDRRRWQAIEHFLGKPVEILEGTEKPKRPTRSKTPVQSRKKAPASTAQNTDAQTDATVQNADGQNAVAQSPNATQNTDAQKSKKRRKAPWWRSRRNKKQPPQSE